MMFLAAPGFIDPDHKLVLLAGEIGWFFFGLVVKNLHSKTDQPAMSIRFIAGCLLLEHLYNYRERMAEA
jgi:hypothetical protein